MPAKKKIGAIIMLGLAVLLSACGESTQEKIYTHLEEAVALEADFEAQQDEITALETQEKEIYDKVIALGTDEFDQIKKLSKEATEIIEARHEKIQLEKKSIDASKKEFQEIKDLLDDLKEKTIKQKARNMYETMMERYQAYEQLHDAYVDSIKLEKELYALFQDEDLEQATLTKHIDKLNASYETVIKANEQFNKSTANYNAQKKEFYEASDLDVTYE
ncbi:MULTISPECIES: YkyA family protein [unclassified Virgibacillus]|uniref:YkyA family protein n=1 Tax=unclassified Virgibacillus TaxID=2620237 RepID=UPI0024DEF985|nr:YkyA family protein [Virgibacillus sp. LDC-1]